ncbi:papain-like cysteine protease family protein [Cystobacter fuscus]|uniref:papain-like cysteine protease family protein n=1 Tax=Cystobacter fuscus TaxID=43 RepID=UPI0037BE7CF5
MILLPVAGQADLSCEPIGSGGAQRCQSGLSSFRAETISAHQFQQMSQWCWAASISMVFSHYGLSIPQQDIVSQAYGSIMNMPGSPGAIAQSLNRDWRDSRGAMWRVRTSTLNATPPQAAAELAKGRPLIIGTLGHAMVLTALTYDVVPSGAGQVIQATVRDPWPTNGGRRVLSAPEWFSTMLLVQIDVTKLGDDGDVELTSGPVCRTVTRACQHPAHPQGDGSPCMHALHAVDMLPCPHGCQYGYTVGPCHPGGDGVPCSHVAHPLGDVSPCQHTQHATGDRMQVCD